MHIPLEQGWHIRPDDLSGPETAALLQEHLQQMHELSPRESVHALDLDGLRRPEISFWTLWSESEQLLLGCVALRHLGAQHAELKSMRTATRHQGRGVGSALLTHVIAVSKARGYAYLSLETGSMTGFAAARRLYERFGFRECGPFGEYRTDPNSVFMRLDLTHPGAERSEVPG